MNRQIPSPFHFRPRLTRRRLLILCCAMSCGLVGQTAESGDPSESTVSDPVLVEWATSRRQTSQRQTRLRIYASGLIESWPAGSGLSQREQRTAGEARRLAGELESTIQKNALSTGALEAELREESRRTKLSFEIHESDDSIVHIVTASGPVEIRCPTPSLLTNRFPDAQKLKSFDELERRLCNLSCVVQCGGDAAAQRLCAAANQRLRIEHPDAEPLTTGDLMMVRSSNLGGRFVQFRREAAGSECWTACVTETPGQAAMITVIPPASLTR